MNNQHFPVEDRKKVKVFGASAALTIEQAPIKTNGSEDLVTTVNLDVARKHQALKGFNWDNKITVQLSLNELPEFCALLMGYKDSMQIKRNDKGMQFDRQGNQLYLQASAAGGGKGALPVDTASIFHINVMVMELLKEYSGTNDAAVIIASLRMFGKR